MAESTLKIKTQADLGDLRALRAEMAATRAEAERLKGALGGTAMGAGGSAAPGPAGSLPGQATGGGPTTPLSSPMPAGAPPGAATVPVGAMPPPPPGTWAPAGGGGAVTGPLMRRTAPGQSWNEWGGAQLDRGYNYLNTEGGQQSRFRYADDQIGSGLSAATNYVGNGIMGGAQKGIGIALGTSLEGFLFQSATHFMEVDKAVTALRQTFRGAGDDARFFAGSLGYTAMASTAAAEKFGAGTNSFNRGDFMRTLGFARTTNLDPGMAAGVFGRLARLGIGTGAGGEVDMQAILGAATRSGMGEGRLGEFLAGLGQTAEQRLTATGSADLNGVLMMQRLPGFVFGEQNPLAQGDRGSDFTNRLQGVFTQKGSPLQVALMRAMGFGKAGGPSYEAMRTRLEQGLENPQNLLDLAKMMQDSGMDRGDMIGAWEGISGGALKMREISKLVDATDTREDLAKFASMSDMAKENSIMGLLRAGVPELNQENPATFEQIGRSRISRGEGAAVALEQVQLAVGDPVSMAILDIRESFMSLVGAWKNMSGMDFGKMLTDLTSGIKSFSEGVETLSQNTQWMGATRRGAEHVLDAAPIGADAALHDAILGAEVFSGAGYQTGYNLGRGIKAVYGVSRGTLGGGMPTP